MGAFTGGSAIIGADGWDKAERPERGVRGLCSSWSFQAAYGSPCRRGSPGRIRVTASRCRLFTHHSGRAPTIEGTWRSGVKPSIRTAGAALVAAALLVTTAACSSTDESSTAPATEATPTADATDTAEEAAGNVVDVAVSAGSFTILTELLTATGLAETLAGPGPFTVFAPTDAA
ncbi:MAG TPA: hypothetical protein DCQ36_10630, partial [Actinobacteria bacterium]|nr:hypothetical protein [Actinomycetota bacterium]